MAISFLHLNDSVFWDMEPKTLFSMIDEWYDIENGRAIIQAMANNGQELPYRKKRHDPDPIDYGNVHPDCF